MAIREIGDTFVPEEHSTDVPLEIPIDDRHRLRRWGASDAETASAVLDMPLVAVEAGMELTQVNMAEGRSASFFLETDGAPVVAVNFHNRTEDRAEIGYSTLPSARRKGLATLALRALVSWGFRDWGLHTVYADILLENEASLGLIHKTPFTFVGAGQQVEGKPTHRYEVTKDQWLSFVGAQETE